MPPRLSLDDRRDQIIDAVTGVIVEQGAAVTSKQLAEAAGVAEGTIFRAFGDKESLIEAVAERHLLEMRPLRDVEDAEFASLQELLPVLVETLTANLAIGFKVFVALGPGASRFAEKHRERFEREQYELAELFTPFRDQLRLSPLVSAELVRTLAWAASGVWSGESQVLTPESVLEVMLHGITVGDRSVVGSS